MPDLSKNPKDLVPGDLVYLMMLSGKPFLAIITSVTLLPFPRQGMIYYDAITPDGLEKINSNLIFKCRSIT